MWILSGLFTGSMIGLLSANALIRRLGTSWVAIGGVALLVSGVVVIGLGAMSGAALSVSAGLFFFGFGM